MQVSVFGANGFVGQNLLSALRSSSVSHISSDITPPPGHDPSFIKADLLNPVEVDRVVKGSDVIVHLAASPLNVSVEKPALNARINIEGSLNILDAARKNDVRLVIFSSASSIVGQVIQSPVSEDHPCVPKTPYGVAKFAMEHYHRVYNELYGLNYLVFRFFNLYGPWQFPQSGALIPMIYQNLTSGKELTVFGDGSQVRDFIYAGDVVSFYLDSLEKGVKNQVLNMGTGKGSTLMEVIQTASDVLGIAPNIAYKPKRPGEIDNFVADTTRLEQQFGRTPDTPLRAGLEKTFSWLSSTRSP